MKFSLRPYQLNGIEKLREAIRNGAKRPVFCLPTGGGKCFAANTKILMYNGRIKNVQDIRVGDLVMGWDSEPRRVESLANGFEMMYDIIPVKGEKYTVNESHILSLRMTGNKSKCNGVEAGGVSNIPVSDYIKTSKTYRHCAKGWRVGVEFNNERKLIIDPYYLGLWLGDGNSRGMTITSIDPEIIDYLKNYAKDKGYRIRIEPEKNHFNIHFSTDQIGCKGGLLRNQLKYYNLRLNKHIPYEYKTSSRNDRLAVIAGLIDSDGSLKHSGYDWISKNKRLADDFVFLCRSVGLAAYVNECQKSAHENHVGTYYRVYVSGNCSVIPCKIERKKACPRLQKKNVLRTGIKVEPVGVGEYFGFELSGNDRMFLLSDFTVVHNTVCFTHIAEQAQRKNKVVGVVCHRTELVEQAKATMTAYGINPLMINYGMVQTYVRSPHKIPLMDLCIIDECHISNFKKFVDLLPPSVQILGVTATPIGASKKQPLRDVFDSVVAPVQIRELIEDGFLSKPIYHVWEVDESKLTKDTKGEFTASSQSKVFHLEDLKEAYKRRVGKTIIFTSSIKQTEQVYEQAQEWGGSPIFMVHSKMNPKVRKEIVELYKSTPDSVMINCGILTAGFDDPAITTVIVYRATTSVSLWLQMVGRGSRVIPGIKDTFYIFDMGNNRKRLLAWEVDRDWPAIFDLQGRKIKEQEAAMKKCKSCEAIIYASQMICPYCQAEQPVRPKTDLIADGIQVINAYSDLPDELNKPYEEMSIEELIKRAAHGSPRTGRPYSFNWIIGRIKDRENPEEGLARFAQLKGYDHRWVKRQLLFIEK